MMNLRGVAEAILFVFVGVCSAQRWRSPCQRCGM
jgi:hypothetical protein